MNDSTKKTVLVIEDNEKNMKLTRDILEAKGYAVLEAINGEDGVRLAIAELPDLVLMDIQMPGIDGIEALHQLRAEPTTATLSIVAFTASVMAADRSRVTEAGFDGFISKPIKVKEFVASVHALSRRGEE